MSTLRSFIESNNIRMTADPVDHNPNMDLDDWSKAATHWRCQIKAGRRTLTTYFSQGAAHTREPTAADVLDCLASDATGWQNARDFEDWCADYGYDTDSRKAERTYNAVKASAAKLLRLLGPDNYQRLVFNTDRL